MTGRSVRRRFGAREQERLIKLFGKLGTDSVNEAEAARGRIEYLLREFGRVWADLIDLLAGKPDAVRADLAGDITGLGSSDPAERASARSRIADLLARHRKSWSDLVNVLCSASYEAWACDPLSDAPDRVNPLDLVHYLLEKHVALKQHEYVAISLWCLHTHIYDQFAVTPRLALRSPVAACGKTVLLDVLVKLVARPEKFDAISTAAIFRLIDASHPTMLVDEADNLALSLQPNGRLRAVFNSGHRKGGQIAIMEDGRTRKFSTFAPLALALPDVMHGLPRTLNSRCITIAMERHDGQRELWRFDPNNPDRALDACYGQIRLWHDDLKQQPLDLDPEMPTEIRNRFADNWRPLLAIADALGWSEKAREAMLVFAHEYQDADVRILLLIDIRRAFDACGLDRISSKELLAALHAMDDSDWQEFHGVRANGSPHRLRDSELASLLREFKIRPRTIWPPNRTYKEQKFQGLSARAVRGDLGSILRRRRHSVTGQQYQKLATCRRWHGVTLNVKRIVDHIRKPKGQEIVR